MMLQMPPHTPRIARRGLATSGSWPTSTPSLYAHNFALVTEEMLRLVVLDLFD